MSQLTISQKVGYFYDPIMMNHREVSDVQTAKPRIPEVPERIETVHNKLVSSGLYAELTHLSIEKATVEDIKLCHSEALVEEIRGMSFDLTDPENVRFM